MSEAIDLSALDESASTVLDFGSNSCKVGFGGEEQPRAVFPNTVGRIRHCGFMVGMGQKTHYVGDEAYAKRGVLSLRQPVENCLVTNWDDWEKVCFHSFFNELRVSPEETRVLLTQPISNSKASQEKATQLMFETFNVPYFCWGTCPLLQLYANDLNSGIVLDIGHSGTSVYPIFENKLMKEEVNVNGNGGAKCVEDELLKLFIENGINFPGMLQRYGRDKINEMVKHYGEVFPLSEAQEKYLLMRNLSLFHSNSGNEVESDIKNIIGSHLATSLYSSVGTRHIDKIDFKYAYDVPDDYIFHFGSERWKCFEVLFNGVDTPQGENPKLPLLVKNSIDNASKKLNNNNNNNDETTKLFLKNIVLGGGPSMCKGMKERIEYELKNLYPNNRNDINIHARVDRNCLTWVGGSKYSQTLSLESYISLQQYDEVGPQIGRVDF